MTNELTNPDYLFEVSWEVCNKVGGIYTVIATKSLYLKQQLHKHHILIGPDVWMDTESNPDFIEDTHLYSLWKAHAASEGIRVRIGKWNVPGNPIAILVDFKQFLTNQDYILSKYWERFQVDSITGNWDYKENFLFGYAAGKVIESFRNFNLSASDKIVAQFHEWQTGAGLLYLKYKQLPIATVFLAGHRRGDLYQSGTGRAALFVIFLIRRRSEAVLEAVRGHYVHLALKELLALLRGDLTDSCEYVGVLRRFLLKGVAGYHVELAGLLVSVVKVHGVVQGQVVAGDAASDDRGMGSEHCSYRRRAL